MRNDFFGKAYSPLKLEYYRLEPSPEYGCEYYSNVDQSKLVRYFDPLGAYTGYTRTDKSSTNCSYEMVDLFKDGFIAERWLCLVEGN